MLPRPIEAADFYVSPSGANVPPYSDWVTAARNIQDAIEAASSGDIVWVTNGIYNTGGKSMAGDLTNRVVLDKPLLVRSLNGPSVTIIQGQQLYLFGLVRCAWLTNGATLSGFTLRWGSASASGDSTTLMSGGGAWCSGPSAIITNCVIWGSRAASGGGSYGGTLKNSSLIGNEAWAGNGGGAASGILLNCAVLGNSASGGGGTDSCVLTNCTVVRNSCSLSGGGCYGGQAVNSILYFNSAAFPQYANYFNCPMQYSCAAPLSGGVSNINSDPQFLGDRIHVASISPCRGKGNVAFNVGSDIDGQSWSAPPSIGCDEWREQPTIFVPATVSPGTRVGETSFSVLTSGQEPITYWWRKDGAILDNSAHYGAASTSNLIVRNFGPDDAGFYQLTVSNAFGASTAAVIQVSVYCVDVGGTNAAIPFGTWQTAATNIQDAASIAMPGDVVVVTNGIYNSGGASNDGDLTNRVNVRYQTMIMSVNGPQDTVIEGQWENGTTNGPNAVRCAYVQGALSGFTLRHGATRSSGFFSSQGGGAYAQGGTLAFCILSNNAAAQGGGVYGGTLANCILAGNWAATTGGGSYSSKLNNCLIIRNSAASQGAGCYLGTLNQCTVSHNSSPSVGSGVYSSTLTNSIVYFNRDSSSGLYTANYLTSSFQYCCTTPSAPGLGNISSDPQLMDESHIGENSPCRGAGILPSIGTDLDGQTWSNPPSIGCDEVLESDFSGALTVDLTTPWPEVAARGILPLSGQTRGRAARVEWSFGDGTVATNLSGFTTHAWTNPGDYPVTFTAFNTDNPTGVTTNLIVHVIPLAAPSLVAGLTGSNFHFSFSGQPGVSYLIEQATNLSFPISWQSFGVVSGTGTLQVLVSAPTNAIRFYRVGVP